MPPVDARRRLRRKTVDAIHASSSGEAGRAADRLETCTSACGEAARASASGEARQTAERVTTCASASGEAVRASGDAAPPSASCEAVRASSVSEASRASASGEAGRAADLIQRPAAKDRKGRVRVQVQGVRKWVRKEDAVACEASLQQVYRRLQKNPRAAAAWQKAAAAEIATNWGGCKWGDGRRFRVQPVAPGQAPQGDQAAVGNAAEQEPAAPAAPASEGRSGGSGSHPVAAADGPQGDGKPVAPGQAPQGDQASVGNVAEQEVGSPAALASTTSSSSAQGLIVLSRISGGSYGDVFKATWKGRTVAVKVTSKTRSSEATKGTTQTRELTMLKSFLTSELAPASPHIVRLLGWSETAFDLRFYLEYIPLSLRTHIKQAGMLACEVWDLAEGISKGVDFLHARSILHRDLKPANILVKTGAVPSACGSGLRAVICDFGLARNISDCLPASGQRRADAAVKLNLTPNVCSLYYRAPEIMKTLGKYGFPSDVWSSGCVFVERCYAGPLSLQTTKKSTGQVSSVIACRQRAASVA